VGEDRLELAAREQATRPTQTGAQGNGCLLREPNTRAEAVAPLRRRTKTAHGQQVGAVAVAVSREGLTWAQVTERLQQAARSLPRLWRLARLAQTDQQQAGQEQRR